MRSVIVSLAIVAAAAGAGRTQAPSSPDLQKGAALATQGNEKGAAPCAQCHGPQGGGDVNGPFPRLAGQFAPYMLKQLQDYASGAHPNDIMTPIAQALSDEERQDVSAYYANLDTPLPPPPKMDAAAERRGRELAALGSAPAFGGTTAVQACGNCHGPAGLGEAPLYPRLAGQLAGYAEAQMIAFKSGARKNDIAAVMREIAAKLTADDIAAVSRYYESVRPLAATR